MKHEEHNEEKKEEVKKDEVKTEEHKPKEEHKKEDHHKTKEALDKCSRDLVDAHDKYLRLLAEMNNNTKRAEKEKEAFIKFASTSLILKLLPVLDSFEAALLGNTENVDKNFLQGMKLIQGSLLDVLKREGLERQKVLGEKFDPLKHEAVSTEEAGEDKKEGTITAELRSGYVFKDTVLRHAMVKIAKKTEEADIQTETTAEEKKETEQDKQ